MSDVTTIGFKCSKEEKARIKANAKREGLDLTKYILSRCLPEKAETSEVEVLGKVLKRKVEKEKESVGGSVADRLMAGVEKVRKGEILDLRKLPGDYTACCHPSRLCELEGKPFCLPCRERNPGLIV